MRHRLWFCAVLCACLSTPAWGQAAGATNAQQPEFENIRPLPPKPGQAAGATNAQQPEPKLEGIYPATVYPNEDNSYDFEIVGKNLPDVGQNAIEVSGEGPIFFETDPAKCDVALKPCLLVIVLGEKLSVKGFKPGEEVDGSVVKEGQKPPKTLQPGKNKRVLEIQVRGDKTANKVKLTLARFTKNGVQSISVFVFGVLVLIILLVIKEIGAYKINSKKYGPLTAFLLDKETNSYSLSKFQLVFWTAVIVFGYVYLFFCRTLVQGVMDWPAIPDNLPQLFAISAGTTVAATGITQTRGSKGAGPIEPSLADFISTGGLVVGDRFQFFVWTLVGAFAFLSLLFQTDPSAVNQLPTVPQGFLYLMGVSSAGYLGGKLVRKPGPVIKAVSVVKVTQTGEDVPEIYLPAVAERAAFRVNFDQLQRPVLTLRLEGENLDPKATIKIDHQEIEAYRFWIKPGQRQDQTDLFAELYLSVANADAFLEGQYTLTLINTDGQAADVCFPKDPMSIDKVNSQRDANALILTVNGKNFVQGAAGRPTRAEWLPDGAGAPHAQASAVTVESATKLRVQWAINQAPAAGRGTLTLISPIGLKAKEKDVTIT